MPPLVRILAPSLLFPSLFVMASGAFAEIDQQMPMRICGTVDKDTCFEITHGTYTVGMVCPRSLSVPRCSGSSSRPTASSSPTPNRTTSSNGF